jgi:RecB family exonuclease|tara:strand:+ start:1146 stop:1880 length:735 start_codon:yes stop_codon:yes gene_type:complete
MSHKLFSPSAADKWFKCAAYPKMNLNVPFSSSLPAATGTLIHSITETILKDRFDNLAPEQYWLGRTETIDEFEIEIDQDMLDCAKIYVDYIKERKEELDATLLIEEKVFVDEISSECGGTADAILIGKDRIQIIDLKTGKWPVDVKRNKQLMIYGLGALAKYGDEDTTIELSICQPRRSKRTPVTSYEIPAVNLVDWGFTDLKQAINACEEESPQFTYGDHCRFCNAKVNCDEYKLHNKGEQNV